MIIGVFITSPATIPHRSNPVPRVAILSGNGKIFCAGADPVE